MFLLLKILRIKDSAFKIFRHFKDFPSPLPIPIARFFNSPFSVSRIFQNWVVIFAIQWMRKKFQLFRKIANSDIRPFSQVQSKIVDLSINRSINQPISPPFIILTNPISQSISQVINGEKILNVIANVLTDRFCVFLYGFQ